MGPNIKASTLGGFFRDNVKFQVEFFNERRPVAPKLEGGGVNAGKKSGKGATGNGEEGGSFFGGGGGTSRGSGSSGQGLKNRKPPQEKKKDGKRGEKDRFSGMNQKTGQRKEGGDGGLEKRGPATGSGTWDEALHGHPLKASSETMNKKKPPPFEEVYPTRKKKESHYLLGGEKKRSSKERKSWGGGTFQSESAAF